MAEGRMIKKRLSKSKKLAALKTDSARFLYLILYPHTDIEGRLEADTQLIKGEIMPFLNWKYKKIKLCLEDLHRIGLIILYSVNGNEYLEITRFKDFQRLDSTREAASEIPPPPAELQRTLENSGELALKSKLSLSKEKKGLSSFPFNEIWEKYPNKTGRKEAERHFKASVKSEENWKNINKALKNYLESKRVAKGFIQNGSTWFNDWQAWIDYTEPFCKKCQGTGKWTSNTGYEQFCNCPDGIRAKGKK